MRYSIRDAERFHGHLGPYLILGILAGEFAIKKLKCKKYFGLEVAVSGVSKKPKSCLIDGLQLSTGATYGKGNIKKYGGSRIKIEARNRLNKKKIILELKGNIIIQLEQVKTHQDGELLAKKIYKTDSLRLFDIKSQE